MNVLIAGGGKVGAHLAHMLLDAGHRVSVIEVRAERVVALQDELPADVMVAGSGADPEVLERAGVRRMQVVAAVTGADEVNLVVTSLARFEFSVPRTIARVNDPRNAWLFTPKMGVDVALDQADLMAHLIAEEMSLGDMMTLLKLRKGQFSLVEEKVHPRAVAAGKTIQELALPAECVITAVIRKGDLIIPHGDTVLEPADEVLAVVHTSTVQELAALLAPSSS